MTGLLGVAPVYSATLPGVASSVPRARELVRSVLPPGQAADYAELCTSELVTNAVTHTRSGEPGGTFALTIEPGRAGVVITVIDAGSATAPGVAPIGAGEHGRGLLLVAALAAEWGTDQLGPQRVTWFRLGGVP